MHLGVIDAHRSVVFAAFAVARFIETRTGWSIKKSVRTVRRYRTIRIRAGHHTITGRRPAPARPPRRPRTHQVARTGCALKR